MARIRSVHPGLFTDEAFVSLSEAAQIFLIGLWTEADDQGIFEWKPLTLRMRLRPTKDGDVAVLLAELEGHNMVMCSEIHGRKYGAIRNFRRYQRPKRPNSVHPITDEFRTYVGLSPPSSEQEADRDPPISDKGGNRPADVGGRMKEVGGRTPSTGSKEPSEGRSRASPVDLEDPKTQLYHRGTEVLGESSGGQITKLLKTCGGSIPKARAALEQASIKANPGEYIAGVIRGRRTDEDEAAIRERNIASGLSL